MEKAGRVGVIGLGLLGTALAERLLEAGYEVAVWNRTREKADGLLAQGAKWADNPFESCEQVLVSLYTTEVVEEVLGAMEAAMRPGQVIVDTTTGDPVLTPALGARLAARGVCYLETPVSGSSAQARQGDVLVIVAGDRQGFDQAKRLLDAVSERHEYVGPLGNGVKMKLLTNLVLGLNRAVLSEGLGFAKCIGLDASASLAVLKKSVAYSFCMDVKGEKIVGGDFRPQSRLSQHLKDIRIVVERGTERGAKLPLSKLHQELLESVESAGYGDEDNCAIFRAFDPDQEKPIR
jgi:3-hydroxyisobutyrate dehydrogenase-like beta-hydroxyacid dehydrogenase